MKNHTEEAKHAIDRGAQNWDQGSYPPTLDPITADFQLAQAHALIAIAQTLAGIAKSLETLAQCTQVPFENSPELRELKVFSTTMNDI